MSVIRDLKTNFSSIAWCPVKEHASVMVVANMKDVAPMPSESPKLISLYDWHLENVSESKMLVETQLSAGVCCLNWSSATITGQENANGLISVGMADGSIDFYSPLFSQEAGWRLEKVCLIHVKRVVDGYGKRILFCCSINLFKHARYGKANMCRLQ